jgi:pheromone alpha factor receptor
MIAIFATLEYGTLTNFEFGSLTYTSVVLVLPLGTLAAQRIANPGAFNSPEHTQVPSSGNSKEPFLKTWHSTSEGSAGISSHIVSEGRTETRERQSSLQDGGYAKYGCGDLEKGVRVERQIEHTEQHA